MEQRRDPAPGHERRSAQRSTSTRQGSSKTDKPAVFIPAFGWRPAVSDYPIPLIDPASLLATIRPIEPVASVGGLMNHVDTPARRDSARRLLPRIAGTAVLIAAVAGGVIVYQQKVDDNPSNQMVAQPTATALSNQAQTTDEPEPAASQEPSSGQPGLGGGLPAPTGSVESQDETAGETPSATETSEIFLPSSATTTVTTRAGDTLVKIADRFNVSVPSLVWSNDIEDPSAPLDAGDPILVPRQDGVVYEVQEGDSLADIAERFGVTEDAILDVAGNGLSPHLPPAAGADILIPGAVVTDRGELSIYTVRDGDTVTKIAEYYGLQPQTIVWANELPHPELINPGQELVIPPGDGALITVEEGETVESIAARFSVDPQVIRDYSFNNLDDQVLQVGQQVLVPGDFLPAIDGNSVPTGEEAAGEGVAGPATGSFIWPTEGFISQEFHTGHSGVDIANEEWTPVNAADGGIVIFAGWSDLGLGYAVGIDHGNGYQTWYGHLASEPYVEVGQVIWQGGYLGPMGTTGKSTGPHLHFVVMKDGAYQNPLDYLQ